MKIQNRTVSSVAFLVMGFLIITGMSVVMTGDPVAKRHHVGVVEDWSFHHVIFSNPGTYEQAIANGTYSKWIHLQYDTRFILQQMKRNHASAGGYAPVVMPDMMELAGTHSKRPLPVPAKRPFSLLEGLWTMSMGGSATVGADTYPAKYSFDTSSYNCDNATSPNQPDYVVYNTNLAGVGTAATGTVQIYSDPNTWSAGTTVTIGGTTYTFVTTLTAVNQVLIHGSSSQATNREDHTATNLYAVINATSSECYDSGCVFTGQVANASVSAAAPASNAVTVTALTPGTGGNTVALATNQTGEIHLNGAATASTTLGGGAAATVPSLIAYDNLYTGCTTGLHPLIYWQVATGGTVQTSPVLSLDGTKVAFVHTDSSSHAHLIVLKWFKSGTLTTPATVSSFSDPSCASGACMVDIPFNGGSNDTNSSPYYDYAYDVLYVGDDGGLLHKFTRIFGGTPSEITGGGTSSGWPQTMGSGGVLTSPVYDTSSGNVFVGSANGTLSYIPGGAGATGGGSQNIVTSGHLALSTSAGLVDAPLVDPAASTVYVFVGNDGGGSNHNTCSTTFHCHAATYRLTTTFGAGTTGIEVTLGNTSSSTPYGSNTYPAFDGTPDNAFVNSGTAGNIYVCAQDAVSGDATLYEVPVTSLGFGTVVTVNALTTAAANCSPVTEFLNNTTDYIFVSVTGSSRTTTPISCPSGTTGCLMSFTVTTALAANAGNTAKTSEAGGTSGVVIDNSVSGNGNSQVYFSTLSNAACAGNNGSGSTGQGTGGCATQASQSGLN